MAQKLYTEEKVREALKAGFRLAMETDGGLDDYIELFINALTTIELPTGWIIKKEATTQMEEWSGSGCEEEIFAFIKGAEWMRDKILNK